MYFFIFSRPTDKLLLLFWRSSVCCLLYAYIGPILQMSIVTENHAFYINTPKLHTSMSIYSIKNVLKYPIVHKSFFHSGTTTMMNFATRSKQIPSLLCACRHLESNKGVFRSMAKQHENSNLKPVVPQESNWQVEKGERREREKERKDMNTIR